MITETISDAVRDFVLDDYQDNVWYNGDEPCGTPEELAPYFDEFVSDCHKWGRDVPPDLTPENYYTVWMEEYRFRMSGT